MVNITCITVSRTPNIQKEWPYHWSGFHCACTSLRGAAMNVS